jgi:inosose dehydratase
MHLSCQTITWGGVVAHPAGVTSIKDLFYLTNGSTEAAIGDIAVGHQPVPEDLHRAFDAAAPR